MLHFRQDIGLVHVLAGVSFQVEAVTRDKGPTGAGPTHYHVWRLLFFHAEFHQLLALRLFQVLSRVIVHLEFAIATHIARCWSMFAARLVLGVSKL